MSIWTDIQRRSAGDTVRKEDSFIYTKASPSVPDLNGETDNLLREVDAFTGYPAFTPGDIHEKVQVVLKESETRDVIVTLDQLNKELSRLEDELEKMKKAGADQEELGEILEKISLLNKIIASCIKAGKTVFTFNVELLGKYVREKDGTPKGRPTIYLMWGTLKTKPNPTALTAIVYVHELMHAYFDMHEDEGRMEYIQHPDIKEIEEPLAEFGMLYFMEMFDRTHPEYELLIEAKTHVKRKKSILGICHYGFGYHLFEDRKTFCVDWVDLFHRSCLCIDESGDDVIDYKSMISPISYPFHEYLCETTLFKILRPKRFYFIKEVVGSSRSATKISCPAGTIDRIDISIWEEVCNNKQFQKDYLYLLPMDVVITFLERKGCRIKGNAKIYRRDPKGARIYIESDKDLLSQYAASFKGEVHFLLYEDKPADGPKPAEWIAKMIKLYDYSR